VGNFHAQAGGTLSGRGGAYVSRRLAKRGNGRPEAQMTPTRRDFATDTRGRLGGVPLGRPVGGPSTSSTSTVNRDSAGRTARPKGGDVDQWMNREGAEGVERRRPEGEPSRRPRRRVYTRQSARCLAASRRIRAATSARHAASAPRIDFVLSIPRAIPAFLSSAMSSRTPARDTNVDSNRRADLSDLGFRFGSCRAREVGLRSALVGCDMRHFVTFSTRGTRAGLRRQGFIDTLPAGESANRFP
jgi:hypothetical protein